jgi:hypothetical protein
LWETGRCSYILSSEVDIKGDYRKSSRIREAQYIGVLTTIEVRIAGV